MPAPAYPSRLGDGTTTARTSPVPIALSDVVAVVAGAAHSVALQASGRVYTWGLGSSGQLGHGSTSLMSTPTLLAGFHASAIAAGANYSGAVAGDGTLALWGANAAGQVGDGSTTNHTVPALVVGPPGVSTLSLGALHTVAVSPEGEVWTWGAGGSGRLGDGGTATRPEPAAVLGGLLNWIPAAPSVSLASGTLDEAATVTVASPMPGAIVRYTRTGAAPTALDDEVPANGQLEIGYSSMLRARAFVEGRVPGLIGRADYELQSAAPTIAPPTGTYATAQTVTIETTGPPGEIRYTLDGTVPAETSFLYDAPFVVDTSRVVRARAFHGSGWAPSTVSTATLTFNYGTLPPPVAGLPGGAYQQAPQVTLSAEGGATIRYTLDGTDPTGVSAVYAGPVDIPAEGGVLKARAYHPDWTASPVLTETYTIDITPPTITVSTFPALLAGWMSTPVTVTFHCADLSGIASCSPLVLVAQAGAGQLVTGVAIDMAGNQSQTSVTVGIDLAPPTVVLTAPADGLVTTADQVVVSGTASDDLSGLADVTCNGLSATVVGQSVECTVPLQPGRNSVVLQARDLAGHSISTGLVVTRAGTATRLAMAPTERTLLVDESATLTLRDEFGVQVEEASWMSSDPLIVTLSAEAPPVLTALAAGTATITAVKNGLTAEAMVTVVAGTSLPAGTVRWAVAPTPGTEWARPVYTNRVDPSVPDLFLVEQDAQGVSTVQAVTASGEVVWTEAAPGFVWMGDAFGGLVASLGHSGGSSNGLARFAGLAGGPPWRYESAGIINHPNNRVAQAPDGTIYAIEQFLAGYDKDGWALWDRHAVVLNGATGQVMGRTPLPREILVFTADLDGVDPTCVSTRLEAHPETVGPVVGDNGRGYLLVRRRTRFSSASCSETGGTNFVPARDQVVGIDLYVLSPTGPPMTVNVYQEQCVSQAYQRTVCDVPPIPGYTNPQVVPDGLGGTLVSWVRTTSVVGSTYIGTKFVSRVMGTELPATQAVAWDTSLTLTGEAGTAFVYSNGTRHAVDVTTWQPRWTFPVAGTPVAALMEDGVAVYDGATGTLTEVDGTGAVVATVALGLAQPYQGKFGMWTGIRGSGATAHIATVVGLPLNEVHRSFAALGGAMTGNATNQNAARRHWFTDHESAALEWFEYVYPLTRASGWEWGGLLCRQGDELYLWSRIHTDGSQGSVDLGNGMVTCAPHGVAAVHLHTHPPIENAVPSTDDFLNTDARGFPSYLMAPVPQSPVWPPLQTRLLRYWWAPPLSSSEHNVCYRAADGTWIPLSTGIACATTP